MFKMIRRRTNTVDQILTKMYLEHFKQTTDELNL